MHLETTSFLGVAPGLPGIPSETALHSHEGQAVVGAGPEGQRVVCLEISGRETPPAASFLNEAVSSLVWMRGAERPPPESIGRNDIEAPCRSI